MVDLIQQFVSCCRASGLRVSTSEVLDCLRQLELINPVDEVQFKALLRANFAKSLREVGHFERLYHLFFHEMRVDAGDMDKALGLHDDIQSLVQRLKDQPHANAMYDAVVDFVAGNAVPLLGEIRRINDAGDDTASPARFNFGPLADRFNVLIQISTVSAAIKTLTTSSDYGVLPNQTESLAAHLHERIEGARALLLREPRQGALGTRVVKNHERRFKDLGEKAFSSLTRREVEEMRDAIDRLVRKLKNVVSRRYAVTDRGGLDVKKTIRSAARYSGVPVDLSWRRKAKRRTRIVTLCDVSGSVWSASRFMLNLLYALQDCFDKVSSFVFIDELTDVTPVFEAHDIDDAIRMVTCDADIHYAAPTDYGGMLRHFKRDHMELLTQKTTLIIVGDGRSNYVNPEDAILGSMRERCRRAIWLNPEVESLWGTGDSEIKTYARHCHEVRPCQNINQLITFIEELVL